MNVPELLRMILDVDPVRLALFVVAIALSVVALALYIPILLLRKVQR